MKIRKILSLFLAFLCFVSFLIPSTFAAGESAIEKELANVIDFADYPANSKDTGVYLITLMEKGYNGRGYDADSGIYVYLYNPSKRDFELDSSLNMISFASSFQTDGSPTGFKKENLVLIESAEDGVFIKARVESTPKELVINEAGVRHYVVSEIELFEDGKYNTNSQAYNCSYDFSFIGKGDDLKCGCVSFLTIELDVKSTSYITGDSALGPNYSNMISSVYFSVPKEIENKYGNLYSIDYVAYKYYTSPIVLFDRNDAEYSYIRNQILKNRGSLADDSNVRFYFGHLKEYPSGADMYIDYKYAFGFDNSGFDFRYYASILPFYTSAFAVDTLEPNSLVVSSDELLDHFVTYNSSYVEGKVRNKYSADLFLSKNGQKKIGTITREDWGYLPSYEDTHHWFLGICDFGLGYLWNKDEKHDDTINAKMIEQVNVSSLLVSDFCEKYLVSEMDYKDLSDYVLKANANGQNTYLFRFAFDDDYYAAEGKLHVLSEPGGSVEEKIDINGVVTPVYLDFDIIELGFSDDGKVIKTFGVVSSPVDIVPDLPTSDDNNDTDDFPKRGRALMGVVLGALVCLVIVYVYFSSLDGFSSKKTSVRSEKDLSHRYRSMSKRKSYRRKYSRGRRR